MEIQEYTVKNSSFEPKHIFECGQCFRWNKQDDESYIGVFKNNIMSVKKKMALLHLEEFVRKTYKKYAKIILI